MKSFIRSLLPQPLLSAYHRAWAMGGASWYRNPSTKLTVIGVTGTKGKSTVSELVAAIVRGTGVKVAVASTIHFVVGDTVEPNLYKMTMPGRARLQKFLRDAVTAGCTHAVVEMTSEGAAQFRHLGIDLDALIFTNLAPEHIESHGSFEKYAEAKLSLAHALENSSKRPRIVVANTDDVYGEKFLHVHAETKTAFSLHDAEPYSADERGARFVWRGVLFSVPLPGVFNLYNCLAALTLGEALGISVEVMRKALEHVGTIAGRQERIEQGQPFDVVVDYAHTPDSLRALYETYKSKKLICVLGNTGGGRDTWKRPEMGKIADEFCDVAILTNEDPYDEDPHKIVEEMKKGFTKHEPTIILDRREAISWALKQAKEGSVVLISGKGTDPYIMGPHGTKQPWSDSQVVCEELKRLGFGV